MCGRFALTTPASKIAKIFEVEKIPEVTPQYNVAPSTRVLGLFTAPDGARELRWATWGFVAPSEKKNAPPRVYINGRVETAHSKMAFQGAFDRGRCVVLTSGFYEWSQPNKHSRVPHLFEVKHTEAFAMAALWEPWHLSEQSSRLPTCMILTTKANPLVMEVHDRMPVILEGALLNTWLKEGVLSKGTRKQLRSPFQAGRMRQRRVSLAVNNVQNQGPACQEPPASSPQLSLF